MTGWQNPSNGCKLDTTGEFTILGWCKSCNSEIENFLFCKGVRRKAYQRNRLKDECLLLTGHLKFSYSKDNDWLIVLLSAIDSQQQMGDETTKYLNHETVFTVGNQVVNLKMPFQPAKEGLYGPAQNHSVPSPGEAHFQRSTLASDRKLGP